MPDRLVKEMWLAGINDMDSANVWLLGFIQDFNRRFAVEHKDTVDAHLAYPDTPEALILTLSV